MKIELHDINIVKDASLLLNGLTVIAGENDSGKSTVGRVLFSTVKAVTEMKNYSLEKSAERIKRYVFLLQKHYVDLPEAAKVSIGDLISNNKTDMLEMLQIPEEREMFLDKMSSIVEGIDAMPRQKSFITNDLDNIRNAFEEMNNPQMIISKELNYQIKSEFMDQFCSSSASDSMVNLDMDGGCISYKVKNNVVKKGSVEVDVKNFFDDITYVESPLYLHLLDSFRGPVFGTSLFQSSTMRTPLHVLDFVEKIKNSLQGYNSSQKVDSLSITTSEIVGGTFCYDKEKRCIVYQKDGLAVKPINVASGIKSFGTLQMLLDGYCISNNSPLIWDEPENHLHPQWQVEFAKILVQIVHSGIPVVISTHSPYFLQAVRYYSAKYGIEKYVNYYLAETGKNGLSVIKEATDDLNEVFVKLAEPLNRVMNINEVRGTMK